MGIKFNPFTGQLDMVQTIKASAFIADHVDLTQNDYNYVGGVNPDGDFQINRYNKTNPYTEATATGDWADRYTLTYT